jgi:hypothetical protein
VSSAAFVQVFVVFAYISLGQQALILALTHLPVELSVVVTERLQAFIPAVVSFLTHLPKFVWCVVAALVFISVSIVPAA